LNCTAIRCSGETRSGFSHVLPPSLVYRMRPLSPTMHADWPASPSPPPKPRRSCVMPRMTTLRRFSVTPEKRVRHGEMPPLDVYRMMPPSPTA
tara:strand:+ start:4858 stop:5136 length:279 start_codon:yes stop_codon:yes gene_type:complete